MEGMSSVTCLHRNPEEPQAMKSRFAVSLCAATFAAASLLAPLTASAKNSTSLGGGLKCTWVVVKVVGNTSYMQQVCRKGP